MTFDLDEAQHSLQMVRDMTSLVDESALIHEVNFLSQVLIEKVAKLRIVDQMPPHKDYVYVDVNEENVVRLKIDIIKDW